MKNHTWIYQSGHLKWHKHCLWYDWVYYIWHGVSTNLPRKVTLNDPHNNKGLLKAYLPATTTFMRAKHSHWNILNRSIPIPLISHLLTKNLASSVLSGLRMGHFCNILCKHRGGPGAQVAASGPLLRPHVAILCGYFRPLNARFTVSEVKYIPVIIEFPLPGDNLWDPGGEFGRHFLFVLPGEKKNLWGLGSKKELQEFHVLFPANLVRPPKWSQLMQLWGNNAGETPWTH